MNWGRVYPVAFARFVGVFELSAPSAGAKGLPGQLEHRGIPILVHPNRSPAQGFEKGGDQLLLRWRTSGVPVMVCAHGGEHPRACPHGDAGAEGPPAAAKRLGAPQHHGRGRLGRVDHPLRDGVVLNWELPARKQSEIMFSLKIPSSPVFYSSGVQSTACGRARAFFVNSSRGGDERSFRNDGFADQRYTPKAPERAMGTD